MMTLLDHLIELRTKVLISVAAIVVGAIAAHVYHEEIIRFLLLPLNGRKLLFLSPLDPLILVF
jgi:Sec-independent protein secretion pathway component TatC